MSLRLYQNELSRLGDGYPVWDPRPDLYDRVRIGDVGYFESGRFQPILNILPPDDSTKNRRLPFPQHNFPLLYLPSGLPHSRSRTPLQAGVHSLESSSTFSATMELSSVGQTLQECSLSFTNDKGAALILPYDSLREDTLYVKPFQTHMLTYHREWYKFAVNDCQLQIKLCDLILVTGCDLTSQWATATYSGTPQDMSAALGAQVAPLASAEFSISEGWTAVEGMRIRWGRPEALLDQANDEGSQNEGETLDNNQCIFIRGLSIKERLWGPKVIEAGADYRDSGKYSPQVKQWWYWVMRMLRPK